MVNQSLGLCAQLALELEILHLLLLDSIEVLLMLLVDAARSHLEALPQSLLIFVCHRTCLTPLVVQLLQLVERLDNRRLGNQSLRLFAELHLLLIVLLQVKVTQLLVNLDEVVEVLNMEIVSLPHILHLLLWHKTRILPALL